MSARDLFDFRPVRWPLLVAALAFLVGIAMLGGAAWAHRYAGRIAATSSAPVKDAAAAAASTARDSDPASVAAPPAAMHLADLRALFKLAAEKRLALGSVDYQTEPNRPAGVVLKHVVLHVDDDYPKVKGFVAELLRSTSHAQLEEIQIEQPSTPQPAPHIQATIKLAFVYRTDESGTGTLGITGP